jgi:anaerobic nitric oxide reductase transcription regulator
VRFAADSPLPDPFDGLLVPPPAASARIHACLGCPLIVDDRLIGALTADAVEPQAFAYLDDRLLAALGALAAATLRTTQLIETLEQTARLRGLVARDLMRDGGPAARGRRMVGNSAQMERLRQEIDLVSGSDFTVLISGETGTGKELVARAIHHASKRRDAALLYVNCAAIPPNLVASELFGHQKGAFTGAAVTRPGKFEKADGGTLFLDEVAELSLALQPQLLRALQEGEIQPVGADITRQVDVRVLAATNRSLPNLVAEGRFRADLFHRLNVYPLHVPPLREHRQDIQALAGYFCQIAKRKLGIEVLRLAPEALSLLERYRWPGNVRELENMIYRAALKAMQPPLDAGPVAIHPTHLDIDGKNRNGFSGPADAKSTGKDTILPDTAPSAARRLEPLAQAVDRFKRSQIQQALVETDQNWAAAARRLGMHRSNLHHLAKRLGLK